MGSGERLANLIEAHFGPLRTFVVAGSNYPDHTVATRAMHAHLRWRTANARHPDIRREHGRDTDFFLEYDTGSELLHRLLSKIGDYGRLAEMTGIKDIPVLFTLPNTTREDHLHDRINAGVPLVATTTTEALQAAGGPAGAAWRPIGTSITVRRRLNALAGGERGLR